MQSLERVSVSNTMQPNKGASVFSVRPILAFAYLQAVMG